MGQDAKQETERITLCDRILTCVKHKEPFFPDLPQNYGFGSVQFVANTTAKVLKKAAFEDTPDPKCRVCPRKRTAPGTPTRENSSRFWLCWMKQHAQKFPAGNLNGARAFHMKRDLFGDFGRPVSVSGCMKESVLRVSWEKTCPGNTELDNKMSLMIKEWHNLSYYVLKSKRQIVDFP